MLDYRWYRSEAAGHEIPLLEATQGYVRDVLSHLPDEELAVGRPPGASREIAVAVSADDMDDEVVDEVWDVDDPVEPPNDYLDMAAIRARTRRGAQQG
jgi:hypothetical protein